MRLILADNIIEQLTAMLLLIPTILISTTFIFFWLGIPINGKFNIAVVYGLTVVIVSKLYTKSLFPKIMPIFLFTSIIVSAGVYASIVWEIFYDGQAYHLPAIIELKNSWNPIEIPNVCEWEAWACISNHNLSTHYPKSTWILAANVYDAVGWYEAGKLFNITTALASVLVFYRFYRRFSGVPQFALIILSILTPVSSIVVKQHASFYVDGILGSYLAIVFGLTLNYVLHKEKYSLLLLAFTLPVVITIKFTGFAYSIIILLVVFFCFSNQLINRHVMYAGVATIVLTMLLSFNPYITNILSNNNPFYPAVNGDANVLDGMANSDFLKRDRVQKFVISLVSTSSTDDYLKPQLLNIKGMLYSFNAVDERFGGFGGLMPIILLLTLLSLILSPARWTLAFTLAIMASVLATEASWWARLIPQLWIIPGLVAFKILSDNRPQTRWLAYTQIILLSIQLVVTAKGPVYQIRHSYVLRQQYDYFLDKPVRFIDSNNINANEESFRLSNKTRLRDFGINDINSNAKCLFKQRYKGVTVCEI